MKLIFYNGINIFIVSVRVIKFDVRSFSAYTDNEETAGISSHQLPSRALVFLISCTKKTGRYGENVSLNRFWRWSPFFSDLSAQKKVAVVGTSGFSLPRAVIVHSTWQELDEEESGATAKAIRPWKTLTEISRYKRWRVFSRSSCWEMQYLNQLKQHIASWRL